MCTRFPRSAHAFHAKACEQFYPARGRGDVGSAAARRADAAAPDRLDVPKDSLGPTRQRRMTRVDVRAAHDGGGQHVRDQGPAPPHPVHTVACRVSVCCAHQRGGTSPWSPAVGSRPISSRGRLSNPPPLSLLPNPVFACVTGYLDRGRATVFGMSHSVKTGLSPSMGKGACWRNRSLGEQVYEFDPDPDANQGKRVLRGQQVEATEADGGISKALSRLRWLLRKVSDHPEELPTINPHTPPPPPPPPPVRAHSGASGTSQLV